MQRKERDRIILHIDMDSFYAAVEMQDTPSLKGLPVVVGADPRMGKGRGVVSTCSYEARSYGVRSGMPISQAFKLLSGTDAVFLPVNMQRYREVSEKIMGILRSYAGRFQQVSIDEAFLDITDHVNDWNDVENFALEIKKDVLAQTGLTCSIGIAANKAVSKIASSIGKPDGLTIITPGDVKKFLSPLPISEISGIGRKTEERLKKIGIHTIAELADADIVQIISEFGRIGQRIHLLAEGIDDEEVRERGEPKSIGHEDTFEIDTDDPDLIKSVIGDIAERIHKRLLVENCNFRTITLKVRFEDFVTHTRSRTLRRHTQDQRVIEAISREMMDEFLSNEKRLRLVGVRVSHLEKVDLGQRRLDEYFSAADRSI
ncbi:MAG: DNA polymerase IV [Candidatus Syntrophoarchaeum caldarius]|uniref:DNA polymerase IV n=1 Tax=Candidatus Syntropharchaeum caldarium TaxID=1838285 RepID=A0A1F2P9S5_9EURY|nr:MAG: DNA polymerase IV [Candidatus Syntrophoarchaeum caldarius]